MSITIVGTLMIEAVNDKAPCLGGNAYLAALASAIFAPTQLVGCIGQDIDKNLLASENIDIKSVSIVPGKTFRHDVTYSAHNEVASRKIDFGGSYTGSFKATPLPSSIIVHFSGGEPKKSLKYLDEYKDKYLISIDFNEYHLQHNLSKSLKLARRADVIFLNQQEKEILAQHKIVDLQREFPNANYIVLKLGKNGIQIIHKGKIRTFRNSRYITTNNPANAGDVLAGSLLGQMAQTTKLDPSNRLFVSKAFDQVELVMSGDRYYRKEII